MLNSIFAKVKRYRATLTVLILLLAAASVWGVSAKYAQQREQNMLIEAKMFYFTSNLLLKNGTPDPYVLNADTENVTFTLKNHLDEFRISEDDIQYDVYINGVKYKNTSVLGGGSTNFADITFPVVAGSTYEVRVEGNAGYRKTLSATFKVSDPLQGFYMHLDADATDRYYVLLTVWTENVSGNVTVAFPDELIPDTTDTALAGIMNYNESTDTYTGDVTGNILFEPYTSRTFRFFKDNLTRVYSVGDFTVMMGSNAATPGTP